ncbi:MAG: hypothetical protein IJT44_03465 [Clostridia bacterium]|nr:hypothetical protein [Clostridia bacterium]
MQKKSKTILTAVVTVLFVLSIGYFAMLAPTTAWFYQDYKPQYNFTFGNFNMTETEQSTVSQTISLRAPTRFADSGEWLFDEVIHVVKVRAANTGDVIGQVKVTVNGETKPDACDPALTGLRWCVLESPVNVNTGDDYELEELSASLTGGNKGDFKTAIEAMLPTAVQGLDSSTYPGASSWSLLNYKTDTSSIGAYSGATYDAKYEAYNTLAKAALDAHNDTPVQVGFGETKMVYVVFWAEYGEVTSTWTGTKGAKTLTFPNLQIQFTATPVMPTTQTLQLCNANQMPVDLVLTYDGSLYSGEYTVSGVSGVSTASNGVIRVPAESTVVISGLDYDKYYGVAISTSGYVVKDHYVTGSGTTELTGYVSSAGSVLDIQIG